MEHNILFLLLAGSSQRFNNEVKKQFYRDTLTNTPLFVFPLKSALEAKCFERIFLIISKDDYNIVKDILSEFKLNFKNIDLIVGGNTRSESVKNAISEAINLEYTDCNVVIHDVCRCFVKDIDFINILNVLKTEQAVTYASNVCDTLMKNKNEYYEVVTRDDLLRILTPQAFKLSLLKEIYKNISDLNNTDEMQLAYKITHKYPVLYGGLHLSKITYKEDVDFFNDYIKGLKKVL